MDPNSKRGQLASGTVKIERPSGHIEVAYGEHESRNGRLLTSVDGHRLSADELLILAENLRHEEERLSIGRKRYADMALTYYSLVDSDPDVSIPEGTNT